MRRAGARSALSGARAVTALVAALSLLPGCTGSGRPPSVPVGAGLHDLAPCPDVDGATCATLTVPLDPAGQDSGTLPLRVAMTDGAHPTRGVLLLLTGGPGQPGVPFLDRMRDRLGAGVARGYRIVMLDQRGTGAGALDCPALQAAAGSSDLLVPPAGAVEACAAAVGEKRRLFGTAETVRDIEALRIGLGVDRLTLDGISYGSYVAARYAVAYPTRVAALVLDSVVPHNGFDPLVPQVLRATARVLRDACAEQDCGTDPAADLAAVIRAHPGSSRNEEILDALVAGSIVAPDFAGIPAALHAAVAGQPAALDQFVDRSTSAERETTAESLSQGLHAAALCADLPMPWGGPDTAMAGRPAALAAAAGRLVEADVWPFDQQTAAGNAIVQTCLRWPPGPEGHLPAGTLPGVPTLVLAGDRDLSTPLEWARDEVATAPGARLVVVPGAGHSVQSRDVGEAGRRAVQEFLLR